MRLGIKNIIISQAGIRIKLIKLLDIIFGAIVSSFLPVLEEKKIFIDEIKRILIIRPGGIGDAVFVLPFLRSLKKQSPGIDIHILCEKRNQEVFSSQKDLNLSVFGYDYGLGLFSIFQKQYDVVVDTEQWHYFSAIVSYFTKTKYRIGFGTRILRKKLFHYKTKYKNDIYELDNFRELFRPVLRDDLLDSKLKGSFIVFEKNQKKILQNYVTLSVRGSIPARQLLNSQIKVIINFFLKKNFEVVLLGACADKVAFNKIEKNFEHFKLHNFFGKTSLVEAADIISSSKIFIGTDSGLLHIATALGTSTVSVFGSGNSKKWAHENENNIVLKKEVKCSPCTYFGYTIPTCRGKYMCMQNITSQEILGCLEQQINNLII